MPSKRRWAPCSTGLGFRKEDWSRRTEEFSGGWQMRLALAKLLLEKPNLLLLDEPTNHLDLEARNWLESYLAGYPNACILISHDRYFLDVTVNRMVEIWNKKVNFYTGNYEKYLTQKAERKAQLEAAYRNQRERIEQLEAFINRFRYQATKAKQVQSRIKELDKIERIEIPPDEQTIHFTFPQPKPSGRIVAEFKDVAKSYGAKHVFSGANFIIERGDRIALVGVNGAGKSTLIKLLAGAEPLTAGELHAGPQRDARLFRAGSVQGARPDARLLDDLPARPRRAPRRRSCGRCSALSCSATTTRSSASACSPAASATATRWRACCWRRRISCCWTSPPITWTCAPRTCCSNALSKYTGTVVFVSHDRYFIDNLATRIFEIEDGHVQVFPGNYEDYLWRKQGGPETLAQSSVSSVAAPAPSRDGNGAAGKRVNPMKLQKLRDRLSAVEKQVAALESEIAGHEAALADFKSVEETVRLNDLVTARRRELESRVAEWESLSAELEEAP